LLGHCWAIDGYLPGICRAFAGHMPRVRWAAAASLHPLRRFWQLSIL